MPSSRIDFADLETARKLLDLALPYLHDVCDVRLIDSQDRKVEWTGERVGVAMWKEIALLDFITLLGEQTIIALLIAFHNDKPAIRPLGVPSASIANPDGATSTGV